MSEWTPVKTVEFELAGVVYELASRMRVKPAGGLAGAAQAERDDQARAKKPAATAEYGVRYDDGNGWEIECPAHGWHRGREFAAHGTLPGVVKCTGKSADGGFCDVKLPLGLAKRRANVR